MLYLLNETRHAVMEPFNLWAQTAQAVVTHPLNPFSYSSYGRTLAAGCELMERITRRYVKPGFDTSSIVINGHEVPLREEVIMHKPFCDLLHFSRAVRHKDSKVLLVAPLSGQHASLLRGTVRELLPEHDVYITDWIDARLVPVSSGPFHLDDYVSYIWDFLHFLGGKVHVIAVCQASGPVLATISLMAASGEPAPSSLTLIAGPVDARQNPTAINEFASAQSLTWFRNYAIDVVPNGYPGQGRHVYPGFLQLAGIATLYLQDHTIAYGDLMKNVILANKVEVQAHRDFFDEYHAVMDVPAEYYLETIKIVFKEHALAKGLMRCGGERVDPGAIRHTALLTVEGGDDEICGQNQTKAAHGLCHNIPSHMRDHYTVPGVGHYGVFDGPHFSRYIVPRIRSFIHSHERLDQESAHNRRTTKENRRKHSNTVSSGRTLRRGRGLCRSSTQI